MTNILGVPVTAGLITGLLGEAGCTTCAGVEELQEWSRCRPLSVDDKALMFLCTLPGDGALSALPGDDALSALAGDGARHLPAGEGS